MHFLPVDDYKIDENATVYDQMLFRDYIRYKGCFTRVFVAEK